MDRNEIRNPVREKQDRRKQIMNGGTQIIIRLNEGVPCILGCQRQAGRADPIPPLRLFALSKTHGLTV